jgi:hypothetical protein
MSASRPSSSTMQFMPISPSPPSGNNFITTLRVARRRRG